MQNLIRPAKLFSETSIINENYGRFHTHRTKINLKQLNEAIFRKYYSKRKTNRNHTDYVCVVKIDIKEW